MNGEIDIKINAFAWLAIQINGAAQGLSDQVIDQVQPQAAPPFTPLGGDKGVENLSANGLVNAFAIVLIANMQLAAKQHYINLD